MIDVTLNESIFSLITLPFTRSIVNAIETSIQNSELTACILDDVIMDSYHGISGEWNSDHHKSSYWLDRRYSYGGGLSIR